MYDFWFTLGSMLADPGLIDGLATELLENIQKGSEPFKMVGVSLAWGNPPHFTGNNPTATEFTGKIDDFRALIDAGVQASCPVPVSCYCAASVAQLMLAPAPRGGNDFLAIMRHLASKFGSDIAGQDPGFRAVAGLVLVDTGARVHFVNGGIQALDTAQILRTSLTPNGSTILKNLSDYMENNRAYDVHRSTTWACGCEQVLYHYSGFNRALR